MGIFVGLALTVMLGMTLLGLYLALEIGGPQILVGICTIAGVFIAFFLFATEWSRERSPEPYGLGMIIFLSSAGYLVGRTILAITRPEEEVMAEWPGPARKIRPGALSSHLAPAPVRSFRVPRDK